MSFRQRLQVIRLSSFISGVCQTCEVITTDCPQSVLSSVNNALCTIGSAVRSYFADLDAILSVLGNQIISSFLKAIIP